ncbi:UNVERIFIED_CONTAM: hypothetical protein Slati_4076900 [Sesamum latifolium]|uniref:Reverse transcriptase zinc-binding domain-containing protein n=1 Tax=Sesamum latifolium TaxID=2727402 RepID=A0AAW2T7W3_9LAMI
MSLRLGYSGEGYNSLLHFLGSTLTPKRAKSGSTWLGGLACFIGFSGRTFSDKGWDGIRLSFAGRVQLIKSVLMALEVYWAMTFILPKGVIKEIEKRLSSFLWKGTASSGYPKTRLRDKSLWTVTEGNGSWGWRKLLKLRPILQTNIQFCVGDGMRFSLWHDPWHTLGPLILRYPRGPQLTGTCSSATLSLVLDNGEWRWPLFTDIACSDSVHLLPPIHPGIDRVTWRSNGGAFSTSSAYDLFRPLGPKVGWSSLLLGSLKIPRNSFILWLAILEKLPILDKLWLLHFGGTCVLCMDGQAETHDHLFFACSYSRHCLTHIREHVRFPWPHIAWECGIE